MNDKVIYTCISGGYDSLKQPLTIYDGFDYICFTDKVEQDKVGVWQIRSIPYENKDNTRRARYIKHNPHIVISEYKYSVWIDSNIQIVDDFLEKRVAIMIEKGSLMATIKHPELDCIYDDAKACLYCANEKFMPIYEEIRFLVSERYPVRNGLYETNIYFREHNHNIVKCISQQWWDMICKYSKRDQLCHCYILWKNNITIDLLLPKNITTRHKTHFIRVNHKSSIIKKAKLKILHYYYKILFIFYSLDKLILSLKNKAVL